MNEQTTTLASAHARARRTWRLTAALIATFGTLMVVGMLVVLGVSLWMALVNTATLLRDKADSVIDMLEVEITEHLSPAPDALTFLARRVARGDVDPSDTAAMRTLITGALAAAPQIMGVGFVRPDLTGLFVGRTPTGLRFGTPDFHNDPVVRAALPALARETRPAWSSPVWRDQFVDTLLVARMPLRKEGKLVGGIVTLVRVRDLSSFLNKIGNRTGVTPFILYGHNRVLAHRNLLAGFKGSVEHPLPALDAIGDPVIAHMWDPKTWHPAGLEPRPPTKARGVDHIVFYKSVTGFGPKPWIIGVHVEARVFGDSLIRLAIAAGVGVVVVILAILAALLIGRKIARPVRRLADAAHLVGSFRLDAVAPLPHSGIREINDQSTAFNSMVNGLRWFGAYVPKGLVRQLLQSSDAAAIASGSRNLTVMFTDIVGFSTYSEDRPAAEVADFLNEHFALLTDCIEAEDGTVDKFIGDSVMAFWGAPDKQKGRATRACRAALAIRAAMERANATQRADGREPVRIRIGIHSGRATVGNIGSPDRLNYTAIGDMVNVAQRMEQLGKRLVPEGGDVTILITEATRADLGPGFEVRSLGRHAVKGREEAIEVFELVAGPAATPATT
jgi:adenylate cyclase